MNFWTRVSRIILKNRYLILILIAIITTLLVFQMKNMRFSYTEANLLPENHEVNIQYNKFLEIFGEEGNLVLLAVKDSSVFTTDKFNAWNSLAKSFDSLSEVEFTLSIADVKKLKKDTKNRKFVLESIYEEKITSQEKVNSIKKELFEKLPFYDNLLYNKKTGTIQTAIYIYKEIVNTPFRKAFVFDKLIPIINRFEKENNLDVRVSGMPYIRTINAQNIIDEIQLFVLGALFITAKIFVGSINCLDHFNLLKMLTKKFLN